MSAKAYIRMALEMSDRVVMTAIDDMAAAPTTFPTPKGGCHPLWVLGHLAFVEGAVFEVLRGEANPLVTWQPLFGEATTPQADPAVYPAFARIREEYRTLRESNLALLDSLAEEDLERLSPKPMRGREREFRTLGSSLLTLAFHQAMHRGHVTDAKRAAAATVPEVEVAA